jgi:hypothetical protein
MTVRGLNSGTADYGEGLDVGDSIGVFGVGRSTIFSVVDIVVVGCRAPREILIIGYSPHTDHTGHLGSHYISSLLFLGHLRISMVRRLIPTMYRVNAVGAANSKTWLTSNCGV